MNSVLLVYLSATGVFPTGRLDYEGTPAPPLNSVNTHTLTSSHTGHVLAAGAEIHLIIYSKNVIDFLSGPYDFGGVLTNTNRDVVNGETVQKRNQAQKEMHW